MKVVILEDIYDLCSEMSAVTCLCFQILTCIIFLEEVMPHANLFDHILEVESYEVEVMPHGNVKGILVCNMDAFV